MKYGMNLLLWTGSLNDSHLPLLESLKKMGYTGVELPLFEADYDVAKWQAWGKRLDELGLERTAVTIRTEPDNPISAEASVRRKGIELTKRCLDCCAAAGAQTLVGPYHSALGHFSGAGPTSEEWNRGVESMQQVAEHAGKVKVMLGVEYLNRFETYLLNDAATTAKFIKQVGHKNCRMMYDTFHANVEEKSITEALESCAKYLVHVHISENDRSTPGAGGVNWKESFDALKKVGYNGWLVVEAFGLALPEIAAATKIWRRMFTSEELLARDALKFMKKQVGKRWKEETKKPKKKKKK